MEKNSSSKPHAIQLSDVVSSAPFALAVFDAEMKGVARSELWAERFKDEERKEQSDTSTGQEKFGLPSRFVDFFKRVMSGESVTAKEIRTRRPDDGSTIREKCQFQPIVNHHGEIIGAAIYCEDLTEVQKNQGPAENAEFGLRMLLEFGGIGIAEMDYVTGVVELSEGCQKLLGIRHPDFPSTSEGWMDLLNPPNPQEYAAAREMALNPDGDGFVNVEVHPIVNGEKRILRFQGIVVFDRTVEPARPVRFIGMMFDETKQQLLSAALARSLQLEAVGRMAGIIAHDFNNLLTVILANLELAAIHDPDSAVLEFMDRASEAAEMGAGFNKRLIALAGGRTPKEVVLRVDDHIVSTWEILSRLLGDTINLRFLPNADDQAVRIDAIQLDAALMNLISNARDAHPKSREIMISTSVVSIGTKAASKMRSGRPGHFIRISVTDDGDGMSEETKSLAIEKPFFTTKEVGAGTGLGLTSVVASTENAGGFVTIDSKLGSGTTVSVFLPVSKEVPPDQPTRAKDIPFGEGELILVVEDDPMVRDTVVQRLEAIGYAVLEASNAENALSLLKEGEPVDLVFSDVVMPGKLNGYELATAIAVEFQNIAVLLTSGHLSSVHTDNVAEPPDLEILRKPYSLAALANAVNSALNRSGPLS